jgi:8-oxo-dGTP pyrophosphatase MutT (NUDIX family)
MVDPVVPKPAATVLLLRDDEGPSGFSVFMVRRSMKSSFMPGAYVFPGGRVDPEDSAPAAVASVTLSDQRATDRFSGALDAVMAKAHLVAAVREVEEEARVRLPDPSMLHTWSRWVTPAIERKRFDTWFMVARLPGGLVPTHDEYEVTASAWVDPRTALESYGEGEMVFAPPTWYTLWELAQHIGVAAALEYAECRVVRPTAPVFQQVDDNFAILLPGDPLHPAEHSLDGPTRLLMGSDGRWWGVRG